MVQVIVFLNEKSKLKQYYALKTKIIVLFLLPDFIIIDDNKTAAALLFLSYAVFLRRTKTV